MMIMMNMLWSCGGICPIVSVDTPVVVVVVVEVTVLVRVVVLVDVDDEVTVTNVMDGTVNTVKLY